MVLVDKNSEKLYLLSRFVDFILENCGIPITILAFLTLRFVPQ